MPLFRRPGKGRSLPLVAVVAEVDPRTNQILNNQRNSVRRGEGAWRRARRSSIDTAGRTGLGSARPPLPARTVLAGAVGNQVARRIGTGLTPEAAVAASTIGAVSDESAIEADRTRRRNLQQDIGREGEQSAAARRAHWAALIAAQTAYMQSPQYLAAVRQYMQSPEYQQFWDRAFGSMQYQPPPRFPKLAAMFKPFQWFTKPSATTMRQGAVTVAARGAGAGTGLLAMADLATSLGLLPALMSNPITLAILVLAAVGFATYALMNSAVKASQTLGTAASIDLSVSMNALKRELRLLGAEMGIVLLPVLTAFAKAAEWFVRFLRKNFVPQRWSLDLDYKGVAIDNTGRAIDISRGLTREERRLNWWRKVVGEVDRSRHPLPLDHAPGHWNQGFNPSSQMAQFEWMARHSEQLPSLQERVDDHFRAQQRIADEQAHQVIVTRGLQEAETVVDVIRFVAKQSFIDLANKAGIYFSYGGMEETE